MELTEVVEIVVVIELAVVIGTGSLAKGVGLVIL